MDEIRDYKCRLWDEICDISKYCVSEHSTSYMCKLLKTYKHVCSIMEDSDKEFTHADAKSWVEHMINSDGTKGQHWTMEQTTSVAESVGVKFEHISAWCWWVTMNMMYSDYSEVAKKHGVDTPEFYADMSKGFLFDADGGEPKHKISAYYFNIVK